MDADIADMSRKLEAVKESGQRRQQVQSAIAEVLGRPQRAALSLHHTPPARFRPAQPLELELSLEKPVRLVSARLHYRSVNQGVRYQAVDMEVSDKRCRAAIPASYTESAYPLQYYFELKEAAAKSSLYPGFSADLTNQPYFVVRRA
jgi:hypothetical protein